MKAVFANSYSLNELRHSLPQNLVNSLFLSGDGEQQLTRLGKRLLDTLGNPPDVALTHMLSGIFLHAWETSLLSARAASVVHQIHEQRPFLSEQAVFFCSVCATLKPNTPDRAEKVNKAISSGSIESAKKLTAEAAQAEPGNLFWLYFANYLGIHLGELDWYEPWLESFSVPGGFSSFFRANYCFARCDYNAAAVLYAKAFALTALPECLVREGECRLRAGDREGARHCWGKAMRLRPWQINLRLRLTDIERGADISGPPPDGRGEILLYSWNHAPDLDKTLSALNASALGNCRVTVLNNGSTDHTGDVISGWKDRFGERFHTINLPTNIGAPAARNWLLELPSSRRADWVVFLDDDALVPPDWLGFFGTALRLHPQAGIVGCRVVDVPAPMNIQSVDLHFDQDTESNSEEFKIMDSYMNGPDFGQYSYLRQAPHVTGCCHLLTRKNIDDVGLFDLRFSPTQFDDFERDLRSCLKGQYPLYQGHLRIGHIKRSGSMAQTSPWQQANVDGNLVKLRATYGKAEIEKILCGDLRELQSTA